MMRGKIIIAGISILISTCLFAQDQTRLHEAMAKLKAEGVDTFIVYNTFQITQVYPPISVNCSVDKNSVFYLYWIKNKNTSVVRVDNCYEYTPVINLQSAFVKTFTENYKKVNKELIRPLTYAVPSEKKKRKQDRVNVYFSYSAFRMIEYITSTEVLVKVYDIQDLNPVCGNKLPNESYKYNSGTYIAKLADLATKEIQELTFMLKEKP